MSVPDAPTATPERASALRRAAAGLDAAATGACLGVMGRRTIRWLDRVTYATSAEYRSDEYNRSGLLDWERAALAEHFPHAGRLLVIGAGGGREVLALARIGYRVDGYECNPVLVSAAAPLLADVESRASVRHLPPDEAPDTAERYDGVVVGWSAYMLIAGRATRVRFLRGLRALVPPGAPVLLSFFTRDEADARSRTVRRVANRVRRLLRREPVDLGDDLLPVYVHRFTEAELADEVAAAGFRLAHFAAEGSGPTDSGYAVARSVAATDAP